MDAAAETRRLLDRIAFLALAPSAAKDKLAKIAHPARYPAGACVFRRGDPGEGMLIVLDGLVRLHLATAAGRELSLGLVGGGEPIGEIALVDGGPRSADATALTPVSALLLRHADAAPLIATDAALASALLRTLAGRLRRTTDQVEAVGLRGLPQRLAATLLQLSATDPTGLVRLSQTQIASLVAATRPKVNLALHGFRSRGFIEPVRAGLRLRDRDGLRSVAEEN
ncbi:MAG TPA: Crp/Fnr family transcriptional regulator [Roseomonas sp.]|jgi:CRP-like cAMP-binding protein